MTDSAYAARSAVKSRTNAFHASAESIAAYAFRLSAGVGGSVATDADAVVETAERGGYDDDDGSVEPELTGISCAEQDANRQSIQRESSSKMMFRLIEK